jgi:hypothetical protein
MLAWGLLQESGMFLRYGRRFTIFALFALTTAAAMIFSTVSGLLVPKLCAGDVLEERDCRECLGSGKDPAMELDFPEMGEGCVACGSDGVVQVIVPGPNRPSRVRGWVGDQAVLEKQPLWLQGGGPPRADEPFAKPVGSVEGVIVTLKSGTSETLELDSNPHGKFHFELAPGTYEMTVTKVGFNTIEATLNVPPLTEPIWLEEAHIIREPESKAQAQSDHGFRLDVVIGRGRDAPGGIRFRVSGPVR